MMAGGRGGSAGASGAGAGRGGNTGAAGRAGATGAAGGAGAGGSAGSGGSVVNKVFNTCRFHFGALEGAARGSSALTQQIDIFTPGWMGQKDTFDMMLGLHRGERGRRAGRARSRSSSPTWPRSTPSATSVGATATSRAAARNNDLCHNGAADIQQNLTNILNVYKSYAQGFASCYGTTGRSSSRWSRTGTSTRSPTQTQAMTDAQAGQIMGQFVDGHEVLCRTRSSRWTSRPGWAATAPTTAQNWYSHFDMTKFTFINTSGGGTDATSAKIRQRTP